MNIEAVIKSLPRDQAVELLALMDELEMRKRVNLCQNDFLAFIGAIDARYKFGTHLKRLGGLLMDLERGYKDRIAVSVAPRFGKSQMISIYYPAWYLGRNPDHKIIVASHTADLAVVMARKVRNLMQTKEYQEIFPHSQIAPDAKAAGQWNTTLGGEFFAIGVGGALAGRGAHLIIADDPHSEQDLKSSNFASLDAAYEWFSAGLRTRLMPEGRIAVLHTRWHQRDIIGRLAKDTALNDQGDQYEFFEFPAILNEGTPEEKSLWPEQWSLEALQRTRASMHHIMWQWYAQYQQNPTASEAAIIKREWIQWWKKDDPPSNIEFIVQAYDTALTTKERSDFSVCQTWGVWRDERDVPNAILLNCVRNKYEFPELKKMAIEQEKEWEPDSVIVEAKASGQPLIDEMRRSGIFVQDFSPGKGQDKIARLNAVADMFASGQVWFPETAWASQVVEEILAFPSGEHDDACFPAGTKITMFDGRESDILTVRKGDLVWTPAGPQVVLAAWCSNPNAEVVEVVLTDGTVLRGTPNHPVYVPSAQAFVPLGNLRKGDFLCQSKQFSTAELLTVDTRIAKAPLCAGTFTASVRAAMKRCTGVFGRMLTGLSLPGGTSTTKITTQATIRWRIWSALQRLSTASSIAKTTPPGAATSASGLRKTAPHPLREAPRLTTALAAALRSLHSRLTEQGSAPPAATTCFTAGGLWTALASSAAQHFRLLTAKPLAPSHAGLSGSAAVRLHDISSATPPVPNSNTPTFAQSAALGSPLTDLLGASVPKRAKNPAFYGCSVSAVRRLPKTEPVYALTVADNPVFYANGVLVHNCDACTLALARIRKGGFLRLKGDIVDNEALPQRRVAYY